MNPQFCLLWWLPAGSAWRKAHIEANIRFAICLSGKYVFFVGKVCIFLCGENPYKNVVFCREALTRVNTAVQAARLKDAGWLDAGWGHWARGNKNHVDGHYCR